jgi:hypothetical protein
LCISRILRWDEEDAAEERAMNTRIEPVIITLRSGEKLEADAIFSLHFTTGPPSVMIKGWKEGRNQTEDTFEIQEILRIDFPAVG